MAASRKLTQEERDVMRRKLDAEYEKRKSEPEHAATKKWVKEKFEGDLDAICDFAAVLVLNAVRQDKEYRELLTKLNQIQLNTNVLTLGAELPVHWKENFAHKILNLDSEEPVSSAFISGMKASKRLQASENADKRHAENRVMKAEVFKWLDINLSGFKSMDSAAEAIAGKIAPIAFRTARKWVGEWKKIRSARTT